MTERPREPLPPFIAWMSRYGILVIGLLVLLEFLLHGWTLYSSRNERTGAVPTRVAPPVDTTAGGPLPAPAGGPGELRAEQR